MSQWWIAPAVSTVAANIIDTYTFFAVAFNNSADEYMAANWMEIAGSQVVLKIAVGLIIFLPAYGLLLRYLSSRIHVDSGVQGLFKNADTDLKDSD